MAKAFIDACQSLIVKTPHWDRYCYLVIAFFAIYTILVFYYFRPSHRKAPIQIIGALLGSLLFIVIVLVCVLADLLYSRGEHWESSCVLFYSLSACLVIGFCEIHILRKKKYTATQIAKISFYVESFTKAFTFFAWAMHFWYLPTAFGLTSFFRTFLLIVLGVFTHQILKWSNFSISSGNTC